MDDAEDARRGRDARVAEKAREAALEEIHQMFGKLGWNTRTDEGVERLATTLDWSRRAAERAAGQGKRLMGMLVVGAGSGTFLLGLLKFIIDSYHSNGGAGGSR